MRCCFLLLALAAVASIISAPDHAHAQRPTERLEKQIELLKAQSTRLSDKLDAQAEARDRQADAFEAATSRVELVNAVLTILLALGAIFVGIIGIRWVQSYTESQVSTRIDSTIADMGKTAFEQEAVALRSEYESRFADLYTRYERLVKDA